MSTEPSRKVVPLFNQRERRTKALAHLFLARDAHITAEKEVLKSLLTLDNDEPEDAKLILRLVARAKILEDSGKVLLEVMRYIEALD